MRFAKVVCQKTGAYCRPEDLIRDGYTNLMVARWNYDPPQSDIQPARPHIPRANPDYATDNIYETITFPTLDLANNRQNYSLYATLFTSPCTITG